MTKKVYVALPAYTGTIRVETAAALMQAQKECMERGYELHFRMAVADSILPRCRNRFISAFLSESEMTDLVFLDHDISWPAGAFVRLLEHPVDCVAGVYPCREEPLKWPVRWLDEMRQDKETGLLEVDGVPTGFLRLTRRMLEAMAEHYWHLRYDETHVGKAWALFDFEKIEGKYWGEDFVFCRRWRHMGGKVWVDPEIAFNHIGSKAYSGCLGDYLDEQQAAKVKPIGPVPVAAE